MTKKECYYADYLHLDSLLGSIKQKELNTHDEHLFIIIHQSYELWFKQLIFELGSVRDLMDTIEDLNLVLVNERLERCLKIFHILIEQMGIIETMTPMAFLGFRDKIIPASGFQSLQFRLLEQVLGVNIVKAQACPHYRLNEHDYAQLNEAYLQSNIRVKLLDLLATLPFTKREIPEFWTEYAQALQGIFHQESQIIRQNAGLDEHEKKLQLAQIKLNEDLFKLWFQAEETKESRAHFSALYIFLHHEQATLNPWYRLLSYLMDIDEQLCLWRFHHYMMVQHMIGNKIGSGGSSGQAYLRNHLESHRAFIFLLDLVNFLVPEKQLPRI